MPNDDFEELLERCRTRLSEISLRVPDLEGSPRPRTPVYTLTPPPAPVRAAATIAVPPPSAPLPPPKNVEPPVVEVKPAAPPSPAPDPAPAPSPEPAPPAPEEDEIFPPLRSRQRTPPPSVPLWRAQPAPAAAPVQEPAATPAGRRRAAAAAVAAGLAVAAAALGAWLSRRGAEEVSLDIDGADAVAVRTGKGDFVVADEKELYSLTRDGRTLGRQPLDAPVQSLDWEQGSLWSVDGVHPRVTERVDGGRATVYSLNHVPEALFVKDKYLWTAEKGGGTIRQFLISRSILGAILQPLDSYVLPGLAPEAFALDESGTLWVIDSASRRLVRLRVEEGVYKTVASAPLSPFVGPEGKLHGLTIEDDAIWVLSRPSSGTRAVLRRIPLKSLDWTPA